MVESVLKWLQQSFLGNTWASYCWTLAVLLLGFTLRKGISMTLSRLVFRMVRKESENVPWSEFMRLLRPPFEFLLSLLIVYLAIQSLSLPSEWGFEPGKKFGLGMVVEKLFAIVTIVAVTWLGVRFIKFIGLVFKQKALLTDSKLDDQFVPFFRDLLILLFVLTMGFVALSRIFAVDVLTVVTSLGIGGLAIALAARETLENLFASFALMLDRPFTVGDSVIVGGIEGTIEKVGFRSTRLRTFEGSLVTLPNRLLTSQSLDNLTERRLKRAKFTIQIAYDTPLEKIKNLVKQIQEVLDTHSETSTEQGVVRLDTLGESALEIMVTFFVVTQSPREFNRVKEEINIRILEIINQEEVRFAFPSRELYIRNESRPDPPQI